MAKISILLHIHKFLPKIFQKSTKRVHFSIETHSPVLLFTHISIIIRCPISTVIVFTLGSLYGTIVIKFVAIPESISFAITIMLGSRHR